MTLRHVRHVVSLSLLALWVGACSNTDQPVLGPATQADADSASGDAAFAETAGDDVKPPVDVQTSDVPTGDVPTGDALTADAAEVTPDAQDSVDAAQEAGDTGDTPDVAPGCPDGTACDDGDACTEGDVCAEGTCAGKAKVCDDANPCTDDSCDAKSGCVAAPNAVTCTDGDLCTDGDTCAAGKCAGKPSLCDDANACTDDACKPTTGCAHTPNVLPCDDGNACDFADQCEAGACKGGKVKDCDDANPCSQDACDPAIGACAHLPLGASVTCDDGNVCTAGDACGAAKCAGKAITCDDGNPCTTDSCDVKTGCSFVDNAGPCDDGNACSDFDKCTAGKCKGVAKDASDCDDDNPCTSDACDKKTGCTATPNTLPCDDGNACSTGDSCAGGKCASGVNTCECTSDADCKDDGNACNGTFVCDKAKPPYTCVINVKTIVKCTADGGACAQDKCDTLTGKCNLQPIKTGQPCDADGNACTQDDQCDAGQCAPGKLQVCDDGNGCTTDACDPQVGCKFTANSSPCDADGTACTVGDACADKVCVAGKAKVCDDANLCTKDSCDAATGQCKADGAPVQGSPCDADNSNCTLNDSCQGGACTPGAALACDDKNPCTLDACNALTGCVNLALAATCDADGDACTVGDTCSNKKCEVGAKKVCDDGDACTTDSCDPQTAACKTAVILGCGGNCADVKDCDDKNPCTDEACTNGKCASKTNAAACDDGTACTTGDVCSGGKCAASAVSCDDKNPCTTDGCDAVKGCTHADNSDPCDDGLACTVGDACAAGSCVAGKAKVCDDGDPCSKDTCNPGDGTCKFVPIAGCGGNCASIGDCDDKIACTSDACSAGKCSYAPNTLPCDDGNACTSPDVCSAAKCVSGANKNCNDANLCTTDSCDTKTGACVNAPLAATSTCDDGNACTSGDSCATGQCAGSAKDCDDANVCTTDACDPKSAGCSHANNSLPCDDGYLCSVGDVCSGGTCVGGTGVVVDTLAGSTAGYADATGAAAKFNLPYGIAVDQNGNSFVADSSNHRIRKVNSQGAVTTVAGNGSPGFLDAKGTSAMLNGPIGIAIDPAGNLIVSDTQNSAIRRIATGGEVTTLAGTGIAGFKDGPVATAVFNRPYAAVVGPGGAIYVADTYNHRIRVISTAGVVSTLAGDGVAAFGDDPNGAKAHFFYPAGIDVDAAGNLLVADQNNHRIRKVTPAGAVTTVAGSGIQGFLDGGTSVARFNLPMGVAVGPDGTVYVGDRYNHRIRRISASGAVDTWAGDGAVGVLDGAAAKARFQYPTHLTFDASGYAYVADSNNQRIRRIRDASNPCLIASKCYVAGAPNPGSTCQVCTPAVNATAWTTLADTAPCADGNPCTVGDVCAAGACGGAAVDCDDKDGCTQDACNAGTGQCSHAPIVGCGGNCTQASDCNDSNSCTTDTCSAGKCANANNTTACDDGNACSLGDACSGGVCVTGTAVWVDTLAGQGQGNLDGKGTAAQLYRPAGIDLDASGNLFVTEYGNHQIRKVAADGTVTTVAGSGIAGYTDAQGKSAQFNNPTDVKVGPGGKLYVADVSNHRIRSIAADGTVTTFAGGPGGYLDGPISNARFNLPYAIAVNSAGVLYVSDYNNNRIRRIQNGVVTTLAGSTGGFADGTGSAAKFQGPLGIALDSAGNVLVADQQNHRIRKVSPAGKVTTVAGDGVLGYQDGDAATAHFNQPWGVATDSADNIYVTDRANQRVRRISPAGIVSKFAGSGVGGVKDGDASVAYFANPIGIVVDPQGVVYVGGFDDQRVRRITDSSKPCLINGKCYAAGTANPGNTCEACIAAKNAKGWAQKGDASACSDGKPCTGPDTCNGGGCVASTVACDDNNACTTDACDAGTGACSFTQIVGCNGFCTKASECDDANGCTTDTCTLSKCQFSNNTAACDDGNACTIGDVCSSGGCVPGGNVQVETVAGSVAGYLDATGTAAQLNLPIGVEVDGNGVAYIADTGNHRIRKQTPDGAVTTLAGSGSAGFNDGKGTAAWFNSPADVALDGKGFLYVADRDNHAIRKIAPDGTVTGLAGGGAAGLIDDVGAKARFNSPYSLAVTAGGVVYVADYGNQRIRKVSVAGVVTTLAGSSYGFADGKGAAAKFANPIGITLDSHGNLFVADYSNQRIRKVTADGAVTTVAGSGTAGLLDGDPALARFNYPWGIAVDSTGAIYVGDRYNYRVRRIFDNLVTTWAGGPAGNLDGSGTAARFNQPLNMAMDAHGFLWIADYANSRIRRVRDTATSCSIGGACWTQGLDDPSNSCQICDGAKSATQWTAKADTSACTDATYCTVSDTCGSGKCAGAANGCDDANACTADSCDVATGGCLHAVISPCP